MSTEITTTPKSESIFASSAAHYGMERDELVNALLETALPGNATKGQCAAFLVICREFNLNPFLKQIHGFVDRQTNAIRPLVGVDGWAALANQQPDYDGVEFEIGESVPFEVCVTYEGKLETKPLPAYITCRIYRKGWAHPFEATEWMDECYRRGGGRDRKPGSWDTNPRRRLRNKAFAEAVRMCFGIGLGAAERGDVPDDPDTMLLGSHEPREATAVEKRNARMRADAVAQKKAVTVDVQADVSSALDREDPEEDAPWAAPPKGKEPADRDEAEAAAYDLFPDGESESADDPG